MAGNAAAAGAQRQREVAAAEAASRPQGGGVQLDGLLRRAAPQAGLHALPAGAAVLRARLPKGGARDPHGRWPWGRVTGNHPRACRGLAAGLEAQGR
eukprot:3954599-Lingulodinium_polyedra.AAC.1